MKTVVILQIDHRKPIPALANMIAGRAYTIAGVSNAEPMRLAPLSPQELEHCGFSIEEIALGAQEVHR